MRNDSAAVVRWGPIWGWCRSRKTRGTVNPSWESVRPETGCYDGCWWGVRNTCWEPSDRTPTYGGTDCDCASAEERMRRSEPWWRWHESWRSCCITCG